MSTIFTGLAKAYRDLDDPMMMAKAWDDPHDTCESVCAADSIRETAADDEASTKVRPTPSLAILDAIDDPLPDAEIGTWEGNSSS